MYRKGKDREALKLPKSDYLAYHVRALAVLDEPVIRAALAEGGILWRLVTEILMSDPGLYQRAVDLCTQGPILNKGKGCRIQVLPAENDTLFLDNGLTDSEAQVLSGTCLRYCGKIDLMELSWWPQPHLFLSSGFNTGIWNPWNEDWFQRRLLDIQEGKKMPQNADKWRSGLRLFKDMGKLADLVEKASARIMDKHLTHG
ncbi:hypothetical protein L227DRAFT_509950 [Lentinus tigrinus ALCF2SS1-6]|uniref:Uncharacterized protein n=1 Tax=Lentinus tigrinus ALCF2SS1-6 TaxID=1328759 RepID=A0A5C2RVA1_9APHY|nr:hypothetical protein L227DRAFT_509950 [Lentinus tigrinus ALCF2SS1-6]